jgi:hypothetical protein
MTDSLSFSGSYDPADVTFLLQQVDQPLTDVAEKERLLQRGGVHYSELLSPEYVPSERHLAFFHQATEANGPRMALDTMRLANHIAARRPSGPIILVSLARAGTPVGVLLRRALVSRLARDVRHFSISIIAGRGVDAAALDALRAVTEVSDDAVVFVDGWTGKGVITRALHEAVARYNASRGARLDPTLHVLVDLCGSTAAAATSDDYLIPSSLLGATVSGLISRTVLNASTMAAGRWHGCRYYREYAGADLSRAFVDRISALFPEADPVSAELPVRDLAAERHRAGLATATLLERFALPSSAFLKPGLGEATRVLLRRVPRLLLVSNTDDRELQPLISLAGEKGVQVTVEPSLPWRAAALIAEVGE